MHRLALVLAVGVALVACDGAPMAAATGGARLTSTQQCPTDVVEGVDVYSGQGTIDFTQVAGAGIGFVFIKASQGNYGSQSTFAADWAGAKAAGVLRSPYHFFDATVDGVAQANYFLAAINAAGGFQPGDFPPMLDLECPTSSVESEAESGCEYSGDSGWVDPATLMQRTFDWLTTVEAATGKKPLIYSYTSWFASLGFTDARLASYPLYIASYASCATVPAPWTSAVFWQYGDDGTVAGIHGGVDVDRFFGTPAELTAFAAADDAFDAGVADAGSVSADGRPGVADAKSEDARGVGGLVASGGCDVGGGKPGGSSGLAILVTAGVLFGRRRRA